MYCHLCELNRTSEVFRLRKSRILRFLELDHVQNFLEFLARVEAGQNAFDTAGAHGFGGLHTFRIAPEPEIAEIAQLHDIPRGQLLRDGGQQGFQHSHRVRAGDGGDLRNPLRHLPQGFAPARFNGRVEFLGRGWIRRIAALDDIELHGHFSLLWS